jgi:hypothetical protein
LSDALDVELESIEVEVLFSPGVETIIGRLDAEESPVGNTPVENALDIVVVGTVVELVKNAPADMENGSPVAAGRALLEVNSSTLEESSTWLDEGVDPVPMIPLEKTPVGKGRSPVDKAGRVLDVEFRNRTPEDLEYSGLPDAVGIRPDERTLADGTLVEKIPVGRGPVESGIIDAALVGERAAVEFRNKAPDLLNGRRPDAVLGTPVDRAPVDAVPVGRTATVEFRNSAPDFVNGRWPDAVLLVIGAVGLANPDEAPAPVSLGNPDDAPVPVGWRTFVSVGKLDAVPFPKKALAPFEKGRRPVAEAEIVSFCNGLVKLLAPVGFAKPDEIPVPDGCETLVPLARGADEVLFPKKAPLEKGRRPLVDAVAVVF